MFCPNCGQKLADTDTRCSHCGETIADFAAVIPTPPEEPLPEPVPAEPVETPVEAEPLSDAEPDEAELPPLDDDEADDPEVDDADDEDDDEAEDDGEADDEAPQAAPKKKKKSPLAIVLCALIALLVVVVVFLTISLTTLSQTGSMPGFVTKTVEFFERLGFKSHATAVNVLDADGQVFASMDNEMLNYYFWGEVYYYSQTNGFPFDPATPLDEQYYSETTTWQDYFLTGATASMLQIASMKAEAQAVNFVLPEAYQAEYDATLAAMPDYAVSAGFVKEDGTGDMLAYVQDSYGHAATVERFQEYLYDSYYVTAYSDSIYDGLTFTDSEIENYFDTNADLFAAYNITKSDVPNINVRHILVEATADGEDGSISDDAWEAAQEEAQKILKEWEEGDATEESFGALAGTYSVDPGSNGNGGLYTEVYPGQMVETFNDWCFDEDRKAGDTGIVKTNYGYHIMYFVGATENYYWKTTAESELRYTSYQEVLSSITGRYTTELTDKFQLTHPTALDSMAASLNGVG